MAFIQKPSENYSPIYECCHCGERVKTKRIYYNQCSTVAGRKQLDDENKMLERERVESKSK